METIEQKLDKVQLKLEHIELKILRKIMEKENEEKFTNSHSGRD